jgi:hypothetical protein
MQVLPKRLYSSAILHIVKTQIYSWVNATVLCISTVAEVCVDYHSAVTEIFQYDLCIQQLNVF